MFFLWPCMHERENSSFQSPILVEEYFVALWNYVSKNYRDTLNEILKQQKSEMNHWLMRPIYQQTHIIPPVVPIPSITAIRFPDAVRVIHATCRSDRRPSITNWYHESSGWHRLSAVHGYVHSVWKSPCNLKFTHENARGTSAGYLRYPDCHGEHFANQTNYSHNNWKLMYFLVLHLSMLVLF